MRTKHTKEELDEAVQFYGNPSNMKKQNAALYGYGCVRGWHKTTVWPKRLIIRTNHTKEEWDEAVQLYGNATTMKKENQTLYYYGYIHGLLKDTVWPKAQRCCRLHTREEWDEAVQLYGNSSNMKKHNRALYSYGQSRGWLRTTVWPKSLRAKHTKEEWDEAVQLYGNSSNMKKHNRSLHAYGYHKGWHKTTVWPNRKSRLGLSEEQLEKEVFENSHNFHSRGEFQNEDPKNYDMALKKGWLDRMPWLEPKENPYRDRISYVYLYLFEQQKAFYVGETYHGSNRHWYHRSEGRGSAVFKFAKENNVEIPEPIILEDGLKRGSEVRRQEHFWKLHYISLGYKTLNKGKTGEFSGSLGATRRIWTREKCREAAMQCSHASEMQKRFCSAYGSAHQNGWLKDYTWFVVKGGPHRIWTREKCREAAMQCSHASEMKGRFPSAYTSARLNGWLKDYTWFVVKGGVPRPVLQYAKDGRLVGRWDSIHMAAKSLEKQNGSQKIGQCCLGRRKSAYGFVWRYADRTDDVPAELVQMLLDI